MPIVPTGRTISSTTSSTDHYTAAGYDGLAFTNRVGTTDNLVLRGTAIIRTSDGMVMSYGNEAAARKMIERGDLSAQQT